LGKARSREYEGSKVLVDCAEYNFPPNNFNSARKWLYLCMHVRPVRSHLVRHEPSWKTHPPTSGRQNFDMIQNLRMQAAYKDLKTGPEVQSRGRNTLHTCTVYVSFIKFLVADWLMIIPRTFCRARYTSNGSARACRILTFFVHNRSCFRGRRNSAWRSLHYCQYAFLFSPSFLSVKLVGTLCANIICSCGRPELCCQA
jgi:hypothetical protein